MKTGKILIILVLALGLIASVAKADFTFGEPTNLGPTVNSSAHDIGPKTSANGLELFFVSGGGRGGSGNYDLWVTTRATTNDDWGNPVNLGPPVNSSSREAHPCVSADGLSLYFGSDRPGGSGHYDLWVTTRETTNDDWNVPVNLGPTVNSSAGEWGLTISVDELSLYFGSYRAGGYGDFDLYVTTRATRDDEWGIPVNLGPTVNSSVPEAFPYISTDSRTLFFSGAHWGTSRPGSYGSSDIWMTTRATKSDPWRKPLNLGPTVNTSYAEDSTSISADGRMLFFSSDRSGGSGNWDLWQAPIIPIVDFNADGIVDAADMCIMVDYWGTDEPLCDIGPMPWGDGVVDVQDLIVLAEHLFEEAYDPTLVAYWALDETEGDIAYDSVAVNDAVVFGGALWQPTGGQIDGALAFDGTDDYVSTDFVLNPADGEFSVFAWTKGGAAGQTVISQVDGVDWLSGGQSEGKLRTSLSQPAGRIPPQPLVSEFVITDGVWHRIGFVWDGTERILYVDDLEVARDAQVGLGSSEGGLYIGAGKNLEPGSFFSGLIDDVRIYNRAITP